MKFRSIIIVIIIGVMAAGVLWRVIDWRNEDSERESFRETKEDEQQEAKYALEAFRWYNDQRSFPSAHIPLDWREKALSRIQEMSIKKTERSVSSIAWTSVGPINIA